MACAGYGAGPGGLGGLLMIVTKLPWEFHNHSLHWGYDRIIRARDPKQCGGSRRIMYYNVIGDDDDDEGKTAQHAK